MTLGDLTLPTVQDIDKKAKAIQEALNYKFKENDIEEVSIGKSLGAEVGRGDEYWLKDVGYTYSYQEICLKALRDLDCI